MALEHGYEDEDFAALIVEQAKRSGLTLDVEDTAVDDGLTVNTRE